MKNRKDLDPKKMYIRINKNAYIYAQLMRDAFKSLTYEFIEVETAYLFNNQYNTVPVPGISENGLRVFDSQVMEVVNDQRKGKGKCKYCGKMLNAGEVCEKHPECKQYGIEWFTPENTYFLKYPKGVHPISDREFSAEIANFGTYRLTRYNSLGYYRLQNARKLWNFKYINGEFWVCNGIGYTKKSRFDMPAKDWQKFSEFMYNHESKRL